MFNILPYIFNQISNDNKSNKRKNKNTSNNNFDDIFTNVFDIISKTFNEIDNISEKETTDNVLENLERKDLVIKEYQDKYFIEGNFPGINKSDIDIDYDNDRLVVKINNKKTIKNRTANTIVFIQQENDIVRNFYVPNVKAAEIKAVFNSNVLRICLPKINSVKEEGVIIDVDNFTET